jgi:hypothetical protein
MKWKGFNKLTVQIVGLFAIAIMWNLITDTQFYIDNFMWKSTLQSDDCYGIRDCVGIHYHSNFKGWLFFFMSLTLFVVQIFRIGASHNKEDFSNEK